MSYLEANEEIIIEDTFLPRKKSNLPVKRISVRVSIKEFNALEKHYRRRGFKSTNDYLYFLIRDDLGRYEVEIK